MLKQSQYRMEYQWKPKDFCYHSVANWRLGVAIFFFLYVLQCAIPWLVKLLEAQGNVCTRL